jgi:hypothetical protein
MLVVRANAAREAKRVAVEEEEEHGAAAAQEAAHVAAAAREATWAEELTEKAIAVAAAREELARNRHARTRIWRRGAVARSTSSQTSATTTSVWLAARPRARQIDDDGDAG